MGARLLTFAAAMVVDFLNEEGEESQEAAHAQDGKMAQQVLHPANNCLGKSVVYHSNPLKTSIQITKFHMKYFIHC